MAERLLEIPGLRVRWLRLGWRARMVEALRDEAKAAYAYRLPNGGLLHSACDEADAFRSLANRIEAGEFPPKKGWP